MSPVASCRTFYYVYTPTHTQQYMRHIIDYSTHNTIIRLHTINQADTTLRASSTQNIQ